MHSFDSCCRNTQPLVFVSSIFEHSGFVLFLLLFSLFLNLKRLILPASVQGGNNFWAIVHDVFSYLAVLAGSAQKWDILHQFCEHFLSCPNLILPQGGMWWQKFLNKRRSRVLIGSQHSPLLMEGVCCAAVAPGTKWGWTFFPLYLLPWSVSHRYLV